MTTPSINPFYEARIARRDTALQNVTYARLPQAPRNASPVPHLTSLYHFDRAGDYGDRKYPGNCGGNLIKDLLRFFKSTSVLDPMSGSGTCRDVCLELAIPCRSSDLRENADACDPSQFPRAAFDFCWLHPPYWRQKLKAARGNWLGSQAAFDFCWLHPPYWRQKLYCPDLRDLSRAPTLAAFLERYWLLIENCANSLVPGGKLAILMGDYRDYEAGFVPLTYYTKRLAFEAGLRPACTDIIRFSHGASSSRKTYRSSFIPGLHDVCMVFEKRG